jgi:hypothetical protein
LKARQNRLSQFEAFIQRLFEGPFARLFPARIEPVELERKLERAMEDNTLLQGEGRRLAPTVYDVFLCIKDHQQLAPGQATLIRDWQTHLVEFARHRHYTLRSMPVIRLHADSSLGTGSVRIEVEMEIQGSGADGGMATQALSAEQIAQLRAVLPQGQNLPGIPSVTSGALPPGVGAVSSPNQPSLPPPMPQALLTIQQPQAGQQTYRIEKPIVNIGRQLSNDIIVEDKRVSRYHAQIKYQPDGQFAIFDLGSTNGITINNTPHMRQHILHNGDRFTIGSYDFYFQRR